LPDNTRLEAMRDHAKIAGLTSNSWGAGKAGPGGPEGAKFSVNIMFSNAGVTETITTVSHEAETITEEGEAA
jgi:hypothetical protein